MKPAGLGADPAGQSHAKGLEKATAISVDAFPTHTINKSHERSTLRRNTPDVGRLACQRTRHLMFTYITSIKRRAPRANISALGKLPCRSHDTTTSLQQIVFFDDKPGIACERQHVALIIMEPDVEETHSSFTPRAARERAQEMHPTRPSSR